MPQNKDKLAKCLDEGKKRGERHQGIRETEPNKKAAKEHLAKALHNFRAMNDFHDLLYSDWAASAAFYTLYHGLLAILAQHGYESRNQSCTFALIEDLITKGEVSYLTFADIKEIFDKETTENLEHSPKILDVRERMQYSTQTSLAEEEFKFLKTRTKGLLDKIRLELEMEK
ncbi:hypothetical protein HYU18_00915 [Candidatus Woesearchaeota archaeon]|nr:hypothetical protein [Candidatus Woesearchaeota archaeon]